ncbi:MAG TPA: radical SAM protein [Candidatus Hydrogenedentes bacterium]|nr:radical SAM protein [Candidatus Hydrogenedentota bacterium]HPG68323.1 radical SAM protein [Candidatus Hydrogenedentota bacterium]
MNVLLVSLQRDLDIIGLKALHHFLLDKGQNSYLLYLPELDADAPGAIANLKAFVSDLSPGVIGLSLMMSEFEAAKTIAPWLKAWCPDAPMVWGGIHPTTAPEMCLDYADYVCIGEGEHTMRDFVAAIESGESVRSIRNLCFRESGSLIRNPLYPLIEDLDSLPIARQISPNSFIQSRRRVVAVDKRHLSRYKRYRGGVYKIMTSRGCPYGCTYCCNQFLRGLYGTWTVRRRSPDHVMAELEYAVREGPTVEYVDFIDDCFLSCSIEYLKAFGDAYKRRIGRPFIAKGTPRYFTREKIETAIESGMVWANMGLQSGSDTVCAEVYERPIRAEDFIGAARLLQEYPVATYFDVIVDNPFETREDTLATVETLMAVPKPFYALIFSLTFFPGTRIQARAAKECPEKLTEALHKDYLVRDATPVNALVELAPTLHLFLMKRLVARFRSAPESRLTRLMIWLAQLYAHAILEPITYFRLIRRTQKGSLVRTLMVLPVYFNRAITYYVNSFGFAKRRQRP